MSTSSRIIFRSTLISAKNRVATDFKAYIKTLKLKQWIHIIEIQIVFFRIITLHLGKKSKLLIELENFMY